METISSDRLKGRLPTEHVDDRVGMTGLGGPAPAREPPAGQLWERADEGGEKRGEHEEAGDGSHEPVVEVLHVNEEGQVHEEPEDECLKCSRDLMR